MSVVILLSALLVALSAAGAQSAGIQEQPADRWQADIRAMEDRMTAGISPQGRPLFVGSSSIRLWKLDESFPELGAVNHGFGGSELSDVVKYADRIVVPLKPSVIVVYAGDNDIARGKKAALVYQDFAAFVMQIRKSLPAETPVLFIAIKPSIRRWALAEEMKQANSLIRDYCEQQPGVTFVDIWEPMLDEAGQPDPALFQQDGLHLNDVGYRLWTGIMLKQLNAVQSLQKRIFGN